jgi:isoquinoline 1-oxidoreductase beta subunit
MRGVIDVVRIPTGVAIIAETFGRALDAQEAMNACYSKWEAP